MSPIQVEKRSVSKARREAVIEGQGGICKRSYCDAPAVDVDHILPLWSGGSNANDNLEALCVDCHKQKTKAEAKARAKAKRLAGETCIGEPARKLQGRGFGSVTRKMDGTIGLTRRAARAAAANDQAPHRPQESQP